MPSPTYAIRYDPSAAPETGLVEEYKLLEVSAELAKALEQANNDGQTSVRLTMKGTPSDDAVICTPDRTFSLRTITVSNSMLFLRPTPANDTTGGAAEALESAEDLYIQDTCHEILELTPSVPRLSRVEKLLRATCWQGIPPRGTKRTREDDQAVRGGGKKRYTRAQMQSVVQSSDAELDAGLAERNVIEVDGHLLHLPTRHLYPLLSTLLSLATIHSLDPLTSFTGAAAAPRTRRAAAQPIIDHLEAEYSVAPEIARGVMGLCGALEGDRETVWRADIARIVKEIGKGLLSLESAMEPPAKEEFLSKWREQVGEEYEDVLDLQLLEGEYLLKDATPASTFHKTQLILPFSVASLPADPAQRFTDLFLTRSQWRPQDMQPFLVGLTPVGDRKAMDKLVVKYVRVVKESGKNGSTVWWHARR